MNNTDPLLGEPATLPRGVGVGSGTRHSSKICGFPSALICEKGKKVLRSYCLAVLGRTSLRASAGFHSAEICEKGEKSCGLAVLLSCKGLLCVNLRDFTLCKSAGTS